ncbi:MAG: MFS transporter [Candidatus Sulfobium sp.]|jgi:DHA1 family tetracycline resistance protein-like MFS transporter
MRLPSLRLSSLPRYSESWYLGYAFQGIVVFGTGAILMPIVVNAAGNAARVGTVVAFFYLGQLLSPLVGAFTDRTGLHRLVYLAGYVLLGAGLGFFPFTGSVWFWMALAFLQGVGSGASNTVAAMFVVEYHPKPEWDPRIGWLQTFYGIGQCLGLVLVSYLQARPEVGLVISGLLMVAGMALGARGLPAPQAHRKPGQVEFERRSHRPPRSVYSMLNVYERTILDIFHREFREWFSPFGLYIAGWFFVMLATWLIGVLFPLLMKETFAISYRSSSLYYAAGAAIGIFAYEPSGALGEKIGDGWIVGIGTVMTVISLAGLSLLAYVRTGFNSWLIPVIYILIPIAWSPLIVGGTAWTAQLATFEEGEALGYFNAATAVSSVIAAFAAGDIAHRFSYGMVLVVAAISSFAGLLLFIPLLAKKKGGPAAETGD